MQDGFFQSVNKRDNDEKFIVLKKACKLQLKYGHLWVTGSVGGKINYSI